MSRLSPALEAGFRDQDGTRAHRVLRLVLEEPNGAQLLVEPVRPTHGVRRVEVSAADTGRGTRGRFFCSVGDDRAPSAFAIQRGRTFAPPRSLQRAYQT